MTTQRDTFESWLDAVTKHPDSTMPTPWQIWQAAQTEPLKALTAIKSGLMHQRRFGADTMGGWRSAATDAEGVAEDALPLNHNRNAVKKDYVVLVGGGIGRRWLAHGSHEDDGEPSTQPPTTTDPEMAYRSTSHSEVQKVLKATVRRYPTNEFRVDVLDTQVEARVEALPRLQQSAGAAFTLYQVASKALQGASGDANAVNWSQVHQDVFAKAVGQDKQPVDTVLEAIKLHSPGSVTPEQIAAVGALGESKELVGEDLEDCLRRIISEATALAAVGTKFTKPYAKSIEALATRAYDLRSNAKSGLVPNAIERQLDQRESGPSGP